MDTATAAVRDLEAMETRQGAVRQAVRNGEWAGIWLRKQPEVLTVRGASPTALQ